MDFQTAVRTCFTKYAEFNGRAARPEFWWFSLFTWIVGRVATIIDDGVGTTLRLGSSGAWYDPKFTLFNSIVSLVVFLPSLAVAVRRLRDAGKSFWNLAWVFLPIIGWIILLVQFAAPSKEQATA